MGMAMGSMLGMSTDAAMKLAGVAGIAAVAVNLLITHWDKLMTLMGLDSVKTQAEQMEALEKSTSRTADETARLNKYKEEQAGIKSMLGGKTSGAQATASAVQEAFNEADPDKVKGALASQMRPKMTGDQRHDLTMARRQATMALGAGGPNDPFAQRMVKARDDLESAINDKLNEEGNAAAEKLMVRAKGAGNEGKFARAEIRNKIARSPEAFSPSLLPALEGAEPGKLPPGVASLKEQQEREATEAGGRENVRAYEARQKARAKATAGMLEGGGAARALLKPGGIPPGRLEATIAKEMGESGLDQEKHGTPAEVAQRLLERMREKVAEHAAKTGMAPAAAQADLLRQAEAGRRFGVDSTMGRETERLTGAMEGGKAHRALLEDTSMDERRFQEKIKEALAKAGVGAKEIGELTPEIARKLREKTEKDVQQRALDLGVSESVARAQMLKESEKEARGKELATTGGRAEIMSDKTYLDRVLTAGLNQAKSDIPERQLGATENTNKKLDSLAAILKGANKKNKAGATFARGPTR